MVRRDFVKTLLAKKQPPKGWQYFTVHAITHDPETASGYDGKVATEMIGAKSGEDTDRWGWNPLRDHTAATTARRHRSRRFEPMDNRRSELRVTPRGSSVSEVWLGKM